MATFAMPQVNKNVNPPASPGCGAQTAFGAGEQNRTSVGNAGPHSPLRSRTAIAQGYRSSIRPKVVGGEEVAQGWKWDE